MVNIDIRLNPTNRCSFKKEEKGKKPTASKISDVTSCWKVASEKYMKRNNIHGNKT